MHFLKNYDSIFLKMACGTNVIIFQNAFLSSKAITHFSKRTFELNCRQKERKLYRIFWRNHIWFFFSVKTTIYDYNSNVHDRRIPKIGKASPKNYHANEQSMSIFEGSWIFQCGKKHDSQGNFWKNVSDIKYRHFWFRDCIYFLSMHCV